MYVVSNSLSSNKPSNLYRDQDWPILFGRFDELSWVFCVLLEYYVLLLDVLSSLVCSQTTDLNVPPIPEALNKA